MRTNVTELPESKIRLEVGVEAEAVGERLRRTARDLGREMRLPGFRKGKVPPELVLQRMGREAVLEQTIRDSLPEWYERALLEAGIAPIGEPRLDVEKMPAEGEELEFSVEVGVRPKAELGEYRGLEVGKAEVEVPEEAVEAEIERLREGFGSLNPVERAASKGDVAMIDYRGMLEGEPFEGAEATDFMVELGAEGLLPEFDRGLEGASAGDELTIEVDFPDDHQPQDLAGKKASFAVTVKEVREKQLPDLDDEFASDASEFDTLDELRAEIAGRIAEALGGRVEDEFREAAIDAAAAEARLEVPHDLVHARAHEMWERVERQLQAQGMDPATYARMQGKDRHQLIDEAEPEAEKTLRREATLAAIADAEQIEVSDEELIEALGDGREGKGKPEKLLAKLRESGRDAILQDDLRMRKAADLVVQSAKPIPLEQAAAREALWTPDKGSPEDEEGDAEAAKGGEGGDSGKLWTPGS